MRARWRYGAVVAGIGLALAAGAAAAQTMPGGNGVARLSWRMGEVSVQRGAAGGQATEEEPAAWTPGGVNTPLLAGDRVATSAGARAEVALDYADFLRLDGDTQATLLTLRNDDLQASVEHGLADVAVLRGARANAEIDTPLVAVRPRGEGVFRIDVSSDDQTVITVRQGAADVSTPHGSAVVRAGETMTVVGADDPQYQIVDAAPVDSWDAWNAARDRRIEDARSWAYANRYYGGMYDLDGYGHWMFAAGFGRVWAPGMGPGWAPYSAGMWVNEPYWGWTWVSNEPWGWAPYHYGRWFIYGDEWVWWPGPAMGSPMYRPIWAPAYVGFIRMQSGAVGWVALGPGDAMQPWWGGPGGRVGVIAALGPVGLRARYANLALMGRDPAIARGVVAVPAARFGAGAVVREPVRFDEVRQAGVLRGGPEARGLAPRPEERGPADSPGRRFGSSPRGEEAAPRNQPAPRGREQAVPRAETAPERGRQASRKQAQQKARKADKKKQRPDNCCQF